LKIHSEFHVKLLEPFRARSHDAAPAFSEVLQEIDDLLAPEFKVEQIMESFFDKEQKWVLYLEQWKGYPQDRI
jgi:hypothetical protein